MVEAFTVEAAKGLTQLVAARAFEEIKLAWGFRDQLDKLRNKFLYIQAFLQDAGSGSHEEKSQLVNLWLKKLKDVAYSTDDVMDDYAFEILRRRLELENRFTKKFCNFFSSSNPIAFRYQMSHKVKRILSLFDELTREAKDIGLRQVDIAQVSIAMDANYHRYNSLIQDRQHAAADDCEFVGRKLDEKKLIKVLCSPENDDHDLSTVAILGMGGLGKTTLARRLYENKKVDGHFSKKVWICATEIFDVKRLLNEMAESLSSCKCDLSNTEAIVMKLQGHLKGKKFFFVLDDVWSTNLERWGSLKHWLQRIGCLAGSVILITTRNNEVARKARAVYVHMLEELSIKESWDLFQQRVNASGMLLDATDLEDIGKRIVERCKGLPLAIKVIGGLLQFKQHRHDWETIEKSELWHLPQEENQILPSLLLSFNHLPYPSLKQCFASCAIFPKDSRMQKADLISLWLAQGFLHKAEISNLTLEQTGEEYLNILLNHSLLQGEKSWEDGEIVGLKMHDLVHDVALYVSLNDLLVWEAKSKRHNFSKFRHFVCNIDKNHMAPSPSKESIWNLRTIHVRSCVRSCVRSGA